MDHKKALEQTAIKNNVSVSKVRKEIQRTIDELYNSTDPSVRSKWRSICKNGSKPTVEQLLEYLENDIIQNSGADNHKHLS